MSAQLKEVMQPKGPVKSRVSDAEWQVRVDLAACYRLVAHYRMTDLIYTHISARVPGPEHHFLINAYGLMFDEITASALVKVDLAGHARRNVGVDQVGHAEVRDQAVAGGEVNTRLPFGIGHAPLYRAFGLHHFFQLCAHVLS